MPFNPKLPKTKSNLYVKNFPKEWDEAKLGEFFGKYGEIQSMKV